MPALAGLEIADEPRGWRAAGFEVDGAECIVGSVRIALSRKGPRRGIVGWTLLPGAEATLPGAEATLPGAEATAPAAPAGPRAHPNGAVAIDHVVMLTPDLDGTVAELQADGFDLRRIREGATPGGSTRQAFFRIGEPILEVVQAPDGTRLDSARLWGLAFLVEDLDRTAAALGDLLGTPRDAVQPGRAIATLRAEAGLGPAIAFMTPGRGAV